VDSHGDIFDELCEFDKGINISGFVDLIDYMLLVSDADAAECFLLDLRKREWFAVKSPLQNVGGILCGKCLFAEGFIFACTDIGSRPVHLAYQSPASSIFLSEQTSHQQSASSTFLSEQTSTSHQPPAKRTGC
jgi:hypothetical protein